MKTGNNHYRWDVISLDGWKTIQDAVISRKVHLVSPQGRRVLFRGKPVNPTRERVRQKRQEIYKHELTLARRLPGKLREQAIFEANKILQPPTYHARWGTALERIRKLPVETMTVKEIATKAKCGTSYVIRVLKDLVRSYKPSEPGSRAKYAWPPKDSVLWGQLTDKQMARMLGCKNPMVVYQYRHKKGIPKVLHSSEVGLKELILGGHRLVAEVKIAA